MADEYVVLRAEGVDDRVLSSIRRPAEVPGEFELSLDKQTLSTTEVRDLARERRVLGFAKAMPMVLVKPLADHAGTVTGDDADATWGVKAVGAMGSALTGAGVTVAILDTGIDAGHEAFRGKNVEQKDFTGEGNGDRNGHGTHCAGTVFGGPVGGLRIGVAPGVEKALIGKVLDRDGTGSTAQILDGILWAARSGANVISLSLGLDFPGLVAELVQEGLPVEVATSRALEAYRQNVRLFDGVAALVRAHSAMFTNSVIVAAAGNESRRPQFEIATAPPASAEGIFAVGALRKTDGPSSNLRVADFSNTNPDVCGPGVAIQSANIGGGLRSLSGTSMATPHVAGVIALWVEKLRNQNPVFPITQLEGMIAGRAKPEAMAPGEDPGGFGAGLIQAP